jgi:SWI/SNF-related matrix-associated actin-dependent regulator 1 of chromatin subfamily A
MNEIDIVRTEGSWRADFRYDYDTKELVKSYGWKWRANEKEWSTTDSSIALALAKAIDDQSTVERIEEIEKLQGIADKEAFVMSSAKEPANGVRVWSPEGLEFKQYQMAFFDWYRQRQANRPSLPSLLLADEMGTGKTIMSAGLFTQISEQKANGDQSRFLVICTAGMKILWEREVRKWCKELSVIKIKGTKILDYLPTENVVVINYDLVIHHRPWIDQIADKYGWDLIICDEAHYLKNPKAKRTSAILGGRVNNGNRNEFRLDKRIPSIGGGKLFLTGTPLVNRPVELWPILKECDPDGLGENWQRFVRRYCGAYKGRYGWDTSGATNLEELQVKLRSSIMIRRRTNEVLDQLPAIQRQAIVLPENGNAGLVQAEWEAFNNHEQVLKELEDIRTNKDGDMDALVRTLGDRQQTAFAELAKYRKLVGLAKRDHVIEHCKNVIDSRGKVVLFAWHKDVVTALVEGLQEFNPVRLTGADSQTSRQASVDSFQDDKTVKVIILNLEAGGVGITLTGTEQAGFCTSVVFSELDWRPSIMQQAERRVARLGADESATNILVHHVVLDGSLDATISNRLIDKQNVIDQAIN